MTKAILIAAVAALALAVATPAGAEYYFSKAGAERATRQAVSRYYDTYFSRWMCSPSMTTTSWKRT